MLARSVPYVSNTFFSSTKTMPMPPTITVYKSHAVLGEGTVVRNYDLEFNPKYICDPESIDFRGVECPVGYYCERLEGNCVRYVRLDDGDNPVVNVDCVVRVNRA